MKFHSINTFAIVMVIAYLTLSLMHGCEAIAVAEIAPVPINDGSTIIEPATEVITSKPISPGIDPAPIGHGLIFLIIGSAVYLVIAIAYFLHRNTRD